MTDIEQLTISTPRTTVNSSPVLTIVERLAASGADTVTFQQIEHQMIELGFDLFQEGELYQAVIDAIELRGILVVDDTEVSSDTINEDAVAQELADEVWQVLKQARLPIDEYRHPILTADRERRLIEVYIEGQHATIEVARELSRAQRLAAERRMEAGVQALDELVRCNLRLVVKMAYRYIAQARHMSLDDLIQEGRIGLFKAIKRYDLNLSHRLSTYATWWIRQAITRALADQDRMIRLPVHVTETVRRIWHTRERMLAEFGREPSDEELATELDMPVRKLKYIRQTSLEHVSLDMRVRADADTALGELIPDPWQASPEEIVDHRTTQRVIQDVLDQLPKRDRYVIEQRFGLVDGRKRTLEEIGQEFGLTRERIRQIEVKTLSRLNRQPFKRVLRSLLS